MENKKEISDEDIVIWYMKGLNDEITGNSTVESDNEIENTAYCVGANDALVGYHLIIDGDIINKVNMRINKIKNGN